MGRVASELSDLAIVTSDNPRSEDPQAIIEEILGGIVGSAEVEPDRRAAIAMAVDRARAGDVVVIAGREPSRGRSSPTGRSRSTTARSARPGAPAAEGA